MTGKCETTTTVSEGLREDHRDIARLLRALERQIDIFARAETPDYDLIVGVADYFLQYPDRCHHPKEDLIVAKLKERHPEVAGGIGGLIDEHADLHERALRFRKAMGSLLIGSDMPRTAIVETARDFIATQYRHMRFALPDGRTRPHGRRLGRHRGPSWPAGFPRQRTVDGRDVPGVGGAAPRLADAG